MFAEAYNMTEMGERNVQLWPPSPMMQEMLEMALNVSAAP